MWGMRIREDITIYNNVKHIKQQTVLNDSKYFLQIGILVKNCINVVNNLFAYGAIFKLHYSNLSKFKNTRR